eukprot:571622-Alexandrium_andersonii.AAC.1
MLAPAQTPRPATLLCDFRRRGPDNCARGALTRQCQDALRGELREALAGVAAGRIRSGYAWSGVLSPP